jgi:hypothetical protein
VFVYSFVLVFEVKIKKIRFKKNNLSCDFKKINV